MSDTCENCDGTGVMCCATCGDSWQDCACEAPEETECDSCDGTGCVSDDGAAL